jgi:hypothetical protein
MTSVPTPSDTDRAQAMRTWHVSPEGLASHRTALDQIAKLADWLVANTGEPKASYGAVDAAINAMTELESELDHERRERTEFCSTLGFGGNVSEPAARLPEIVDNVEEAFAAAQDHDECPGECPGCGERLADKSCEWCQGAGGHVAQGAYSECSNCGGVTRIHEGCAGQSYADLVKERDEARAEVDSLQARLNTAAALHKPQPRFAPATAEHPGHCVHCGHEWPCPDVWALGISEGDSR